MTKRNLIAVALLCVVALVGFGLLRTSATSAGLQKPQHAEGGPVIALDKLPGVEIVSREYVPDPEKYGHGTLRIRIKDTTGRKVKAWTLTTNTGSSNRSVTTYPRDGTSDYAFYTEIGVQEDATTSLAIAYEDGGVVGKSKAAVRALRDSLKKVEASDAKMDKERAKIQKEEVKRQQ